MIQIKNLSKKYKDFYALKNINLILPSKGLIGISGESGSGKSTLLNALALMDNNYEGEIIINNKNILKYSEDQKDKYHLNIGYVFQSPYLFNFCTVKENIEYLAMIKGKKENVKELLKLVGLEKYQNKKVNALSGGQRQRVSIAASLVSRPQILLCDEPTGALDSENSEKLMKILKSVSSSTLVIVVSHDLNLLKEYADNIIYLKDGQVVNSNSIEIKQDEKIKFKGIKFFSYLKFIILFALKNIINHQKRTILTSLMISFGLIGIILSILLNDGFSSFFTSSLGSYESNTYTYCYSLSENDDLVISIDTFEEDFKNYEKGYFYKYEFKDNSSAYLNEIKIEEKSSFLNLNHLCYLMKTNYTFTNKEIGLSCSSDYLNYLFNLYQVNSISNLNNYLKRNDVKMSFNYLDNQMNLSFELRLKYVEDSKSDYTYFIHSSSSFLKEYFKDYLSLNFSDEHKIVILPYIKHKDSDKSDLLLNENKKKYEYLFDNEIYNEKYTFVFKSNYYRMDMNLANEMSELIDSNYYLSMEKGIDMMGRFNSSFTISSEYKEINGQKITFIPDSNVYNSLEYISISSGLFNLVNNSKISIKGYDYFYDLNVINIIENDDLVIYQNSQWSYLFFRELFNFKAYECIGVAIAFSKNDDLTINTLKENYPNFEFVCPLKEISKEIDSMVEKIKIVLMVLSSFCIVISLFLMAVIVFINTIEQSKLIAGLRVNGIGKFDVVLIFILESLLLGLLSFAISYYFALMFSIELNMVFNSLLDDDLNIIALKKDTLKNVFSLVMLMSFVSGLIPSLIASKKNPLKVLKS